jgi:hypothetical protein
MQKGIRGKVPGPEDDNILFQIWNLRRRYPSALPMPCLHFVPMELDVDYV